ncbi:DUF3592 domain-containing protein [Aeromicrobium sp. A1-2]|uniref:DUF3592 domain-containing protein n=1 Tax=Aeromicrobium sp. A1-2 TaxID=2107713 RepID=UPI0013C2F824|nr:DUF3592 domain-containing protein [Aeromicrobium sp. A1-2]
MSDLVAVGLSILGGGAVVATVFFLVAWSRTSMARGWTATTGVVIDRRTGRAEGGIPAQHPTFQWQDADGNLHQETSSMKQSLGPAPGTRVPVLYDPAHPSRAVINTYVQSGRLFWALGFLVLALGILIGGFLLLGAARMN